MADAKGFGRPTKQQRMDALRRRAAAAMPDWRIEPLDGKIVITASDGPDVDFVATLRDEANLDNRDFLVCLPEEHFFLIDQYNKLSKRFRELTSEASSRSAPDDESATSRGQVSTRARDCGILCGDKAFQKFLEIEHSIDISTAASIADGVRRKLSVESRAELSTDPEAAARWDKFVGSFRLWMRGM
ncbi:hypothetical protein C8J36_103553 [Rhizobium sp. PP-F2F-G48]|uniref:hypothetical protein n=1 Tax=Rhizobium sp. PP-F2F-G48 TaxID=2135651 RepID=UPI00104A240C|nr:hypothetical protein [Rhizobium sp. PP-F2F-G48]TCM56183.1 hypothetical protein C8J36_103553 [Rhizobium sp. PP-F2F-G48]